MLVKTDPGNQNPTNQLVKVHISKVITPGLSDHKGRFHRVSGTWQKGALAQKGKVFRKVPRG
jgi:hypothetical protein